MRNIRFGASLVALALIAAPAGAATLEEIATAMGTARVNNLQYTGSGTFHLLGQARVAGQEWPGFPMKATERTLDYANAAMLDRQTYNQPPQGVIAGGGAQPFNGDVNRIVGVFGETAWTGTGQAATAAQGNLALLQHDLWTSAHGIIKAAMADRAATRVDMGNTMFTIERAGRFRATATANAQNLITRVESVVGQPNLGDMTVVTTFENYRDHDGVKLPGRVVTAVMGHPTLQVNIAEVKINPGAIAMPQLNQPAPPAANPPTAQIAPGIHFIQASHNSIAIEMADHVVVIEAPLAEARTAVVVEETKKAIPNKPIRTLINTHHHFDHSGGVRAAVAEGMTLVTAAVNKPYYERIFANPRALSADRMSRANATAKIEGVGDKMVLTDGTRTIELYPMQGHLHAEGNLIIYLPREKMLIVADAFSPRAVVSAVNPRPNPNTANLWENIRRLGLDVQTVAPIHGRFVKVDELRMDAGIM